MQKTASLLYAFLSLKIHLNDNKCHTPFIKHADIANATALSFVYAA